MGYPQKSRVYTYTGPDFTSPDGSIVHSNTEHSVKTWAKITKTPYPTLYSRVHSPRKITQRIFNHWINPKCSVGGDAELMPSISKKYTNYIKNRDENIREMLGQGVPVSKIYKELGVSSATVTSISKSMDMKKYFIPKGTLILKERNVRCKCPYCGKVYHLKTNEYSGKGVWYRYCDPDSKCAGRLKSRKESPLTPHGKTFDE